MFEIKEITEDNFNEAFELANKGFNLKSNISKKLYNFIFQSNLSIKFFGYGLYLDKNIAGVLFTPIQGYIQKKPFVSLICFFVIPSCRGVQAIQFLNNTTNLMKYKFAFVTNYTPSKAVINISRKLGYKLMPVNYVISKPFCIISSCFIYLFDNARQLKRFQVKKEYFKPCFKSIEFCESKNISSFIYKNNLKNIEIKFSGFFTRKKKLIKLFHIIFSTSDKSLILFLPEIQTYFLFRYGCFILANVSLLNIAKYKKNKNNFFINSKPSYLILGNEENIVYIPGLGSELPIS